MSRTDEAFALVLAGHSKKEAAKAVGISASGFYRACNARGVTFLTLAGRAAISSAVKMRWERWRTNNQRPKKVKKLKSAKGYVAKHGHRRIAITLSDQMFTDIAARAERNGISFCEQVRHELGAKT